MSTAKRKILFVDDEPNIIDGLRRMLRKQRTEWDMEFCSNAEGAMAKMATIPFDVIITDLQMPGMDGAELLEKVVEKYPSTARIVLSGHADENMTRRALGVAHRYLAKPTDADTLVAAVGEACGAQQALPDDKLKSLVAGCDALPSAPHMYTEITKAAESETADAAVIAKIISGDMAMSAKLLQLVNSSFFGLARRVSSIEQTVSLLGMLRIKALVLTDNIFRRFAPPRDIPHVRIDRLWNHSMRVAELARAISRAEKQGGDRPDQAFTAGLLHDIGLLVLAYRRADALIQIGKLSAAENVSIEALEREILGATHSEVGAYLLRLWGLPARIVEAVSFHHTPNTIKYDGLCAVTVVHVADVLDATKHWAPGAKPDDLYPVKIDMEYLARLGLVDRVPHWQTLVSEDTDQSGPTS